jgi:hypothetical protein
MVQRKSPFRVERDGHIAWLILDRPEKRNAMGFDFYDGLAEHFAAFDEDPEVRVVVMRAEGKSFTTGTDLAELGSLYTRVDAGSREKLRLMILKAQGGINQIEKCRKPVIAAVHSHCLGGRCRPTVRLRYPHRHAGRDLRHQGGSGGLYCRCRHPAATSAHYRSRVVPGIGTDRTGFRRR